LMVCIAHLAKISLVNLVYWQRRILSRKTMGKMLILKT